MTKPTKRVEPPEGRLAPLTSSSATAPPRTEPDAAMRVRDVMTRHVRTLREGDSIELAAAVLRFWSFRHLPILDAGGRVVGMLTPTDVMGATARWQEPHRLAVSEIMRRPVETILGDESLEAAAERMRSRGVHVLPVVGPEAQLVGIVTDVDVLASLARSHARPRPRSKVSVDVVMTPNPLTIDRDASLADAVEALQRGRIRHLPVLDHRGQLVGMLSERDLRSRLGADVQGFTDATLDALGEPVSEAMTPDPISVRSGTSLDDVLETFATERIGALPVVDEADALLGIVSYVDLLMWLRGDDSRVSSGSRGP